MEASASLRVLAAFASPLVITAAALGPSGVGRVARLAGPAVWVITLGAAALSALAMPGIFRGRRLPQGAPLALAALTLVAGPLALAARLPRALGRLDPVPFGVNGEVFAELYAAAAVAAVVAASLAASLAARDDADERRPARLVALALAAAALTRAVETGLCAVALGRPSAGSQARLAIGDGLGWLSVALGVVGLAAAARRPAARPAAAVAFGTLAAALAFDEGALRSWGAVGRPDLTEEIRLPVVAAPASTEPPVWHAALTRGEVALPDGRRLPLAGAALTAHLRATLPAALPADRGTESRSLRCLGNSIEVTEFAVVADASLPRAALVGLVAAAEEASVSRLTFLARVDRAPKADSARVRLLPPPVARVTLHLSPTRRSCPNATGRDPIAPLPEGDLGALLRDVTERPGRADNPAGALFTADAAPR